MNQNSFVRVARLIICEIHAYVICTEFSTTDSATVNDVTIFVDFCCRNLRGFSSTWDLLDPTLPHIVLDKVGVRKLTLWRPL